MKSNPEIEFWIDPAKSKYKNEILIANVFILENEDDNPFHKSKRIIQKIFPLDVIPPEFKAQMEKEKDKIYHMFPLEYV